MHNKLRDFVETTWVPASRDDDYFDKEGRNIAKNFLDFLTEARGASSIMSLKCGP